MSECVVRMEMPSCCHDCPFEADQWDYPICRVTGRSEGYRFDARNNRMVDCPIICQLPKVHGRLVDADDCIKHLFTEWVKGEISNSEWCNIRQWVNEETTIVPAEAESLSPKPTDPLSIRGVEYVMTECDVKTGTVTYEPRERIEL